MRAEWLLWAGAAFHVVIAAYHVWFFRLFDWGEELARLAPINRAIMRTLNQCLIYVFLGIAFFEIRFTAELLTTPLGRALVAGVGVLWLLRAALQWLCFEGRARRSLGAYATCLAAAALHFAALAA